LDLENISLNFKFNDEFQIKNPINGIEIRVMELLKPTVSKAPKREENHRYNGMPINPDSESILSCFHRRLFENARAPVRKMRLIR